MKIALINENSQASKNKIIYDALKQVADLKGYEVFNYGMENEKENNLTYVQAGLLAGILINSKAADFIVTGCGTGEGAMLALNSFPNVQCGHITDPTDAYLFGQINAGNAISIGFAKGFGWGSELTLTYIFEKLFADDFGGGYPKERAIPEQANKMILDKIRQITQKDMLTILIEIDQDFLYQTINREQFKKAIPLGYDAAVCYVNTAMGNEDGIFKESQVNDQVAFNEDYAKTLSGKKKNYKNKDDFLNEQVAYYIGNISEWDEIAEKFPGHWSAKAYTSTLKVRYGDFVGISNEASSNQQNAGMLFIYELLTDLAQNNTYIQNGGIDLLPVNEETCEIFFKTHSDFDFIEEIEEAKVYGFIENKKEE